MKKNQSLTLFWQIFYGFFKIGAFTFGGGFAMIPLIKREVVATRGWLGEEEFVDIIGIAQSSPGPVAVNTAIFSGYKIAGLAGAIVGLLGVVLPSFMVILILTTFLLQYQSANWMQAIFKGVRPAIFAQIVAAGIDIAKSTMKNTFAIAVGVIGLVLLVLVDVHPIFVIAAAAATGILYSKFGPREGTAGANS